VTLYLTLDDLLQLAQAVVGDDVKVRDAGLLGAAAARPETSAFGAAAYPTLAEKAVALLHSIARNHALIDGNKRLALAAATVFCGVNGHYPYPALSNDEAYAMTMDAATGELDVPDIAAVLRRAGVP
jgi:death-on-curing protein